MQNRYGILRLKTLLKQILTLYYYHNLRKIILYNLENIPILNNQMLGNHLFIIWQRDFRNLIFRNFK